MVVYIVFTRVQTLDRAELEEYWRKIAITAGGHPIKILAAYGKQEILEGPAVEGVIVHTRLGTRSNLAVGVVIAEFPTVEDVKKWYFSPEYQAAADHRKKGAVYHGLIVEGVSSQQQ